MIKIMEHEILMAKMQGDTTTSKNIFVQGLQQQRGLSYQVSCYNIPQRHLFKLYKR